MKIVFAILIIVSAFSCGQNNKKESDTQSSKRMENKYVKIDDTTIATKDPMKVIDPLWWTVDIYNSKEQYEKDLEPYSFHQRAVFAIMWYMGEVNNGGHYQFYTNSTGIVWEDAMDGFELIGLDEGKRIIEESAKRFGSKPSFDRTERENFLDSIDEDFEDLDSRFYKLDSELNLTDKIAQYISANPIPFYFEGEIEIPK
jgi:hypothetical protein